LFEKAWTVLEDVDDVPDDHPMFQG
jgi:hypothetical protein